MLYTLLKFLGWGALLAFIGGCIGWALRALKCRGEIARANSATVDDDEVERMRHRLANLEQVVAERDRLRIQLADVRHADSPGIVGAEVPEPPPEPEPESPRNDEADAPPEAADPADVDVMDEVVESEAPPFVRDAALDHSGAGDTNAGDTDVVHTGASPADSPTTVDGFVDASDDEPARGEPTESVILDLDLAASVLGKKIKLDDLTVVDGIGPKISELCSGIGLTTWRQLADVDVEDLQSMLDAAGSRYTVHKPGAWPHQAELLAAGRWADFKTLTEELDGGK